MKQVGIRVSDISLERLNGETILISFENGRYYNSRGPASDLIFLISNEVKIENWIRILSDSYTDLPLNDNGIEKFISKGIQESIFEYRENYSLEEIVLPADMNRTRWESPILEIYEDFQDLLMVDPIHDTTEEGWPKLNDQ